MLLQISKYRCKIEKIITEFTKGEARRPKFKLSRVFDVTFRKIKTGLEVYNKDWSEGPTVYSYTTSSQVLMILINFKLYYPVMIIGVIVNQMS